MRFWVILAILSPSLAIPSTKTYVIQSQCDCWAQSGQKGITSRQEIGELGEKLAEEKHNGKKYVLLSFGKNAWGKEFKCWFHRENLLSFRLFKKPIKWPIKSFKHEAGDASYEYTFNRSGNFRWVSTYGVEGQPDRKQRRKGYTLVYKNFVFFIFDNGSYPRFFFLRNGKLWHSDFDWISQENVK